MMNVSLIISAKMSINLTCLSYTYTYSACSDQSKKSGARHQDLPLRVSQDIIGEETTSTIHAIIELLQHSTVQYSTLLTTRPVSCFLNFYTVMRCQTQR